MFYTNKITFPPPIYSLYSTMYNGTFPCQLINLYKYTIYMWYKETIRVRMACTTACLLCRQMHQLRDKRATILTKESLTSKLN